MSTYPFGPFGLDPSSIINVASNATGDGSANPAYGPSDFQGTFPQFNVLPAGILTMFISMANATVLQSQWHDNWHYGMDLFIAHFATLYVQSMAAGSSSTANQVIAAAQAKGLQSSKSVGDVSVSYDFSTIGEGLKNWAMFNSTIYGQQFATFAKVLGKAGMYVW